MDQIFFVNSASIVDVTITSSLIAAAGSTVDFSNATGSYAGTLVGNASTATSASYAGTASVIIGSIATASYAISASHATVSDAAISSSFASTATTATTAQTAATASYYQIFPNIKSGKISASAFGGNPRTASVTFSTPYTNTNYSVNIVGGDARSWTLEQVSASKFTVSTNSKQILTDFVYWTSIGNGESN